MSALRPTVRLLRPRWFARWGALAVSSALVALAACSKEVETEWVQFNAPDDLVSVEVGASDVGEAVTTDLHSTSGSVVIGSGTVSPGSGPIGTDHEVTVVVDDAYESIVTRATVRLDAGARGVDEYELDQDSADHGRWWVVLTSVGDEGETRTDTVTFRVWEEVIVDEEPTTTTSTTGTTGTEG